MNAPEMSVSGTRCCSGSNTHADLQDPAQPVSANPFARAADARAHDTFATTQHSQTQEAHVATAVEIIPVHEVPSGPASFMPILACDEGFTPDPDDLRHLVWIWVSAMIIRGSNFRSSTTRGLALVRTMAGLSFTDISGTHHAPIAALDPATDAEIALRDMGLDAPAIDAMCQRAMALQGKHAVLPADLVMTLVPLEYWPVLARLVSDGPGATWERFNRAMALEASRPTKRKDRRRSGEAAPRLTASALRIAQTTFRTLMRPLVDLKASGSPSVWLKPWGTSLPESLSIRSLNPDSFRADRSAPDLLSTRRAWQRLDKRAARQLSTKRGRETARIILRDRALIAVVLGTGMRIDAVARLRACDFNPSHRFAVSDEVGPAIRATPRKGRTDQVWKGVHPVVGRCLAEYMDYMGIDPTSTDPMWPSSHKRGKQTGKAIAMHTNPLSLRFSGDSRKVKAFLPLPYLPNSTAPNENPMVGFSPHTFRHLAEQYIFEAASDYLADNPDERRFITAQVIADAALDHVQGSDGLGYKDLDEPRMKEHLTRIGLLGLGEYIWGERGAREAPDLLRVEAADRAVAETEVALDDAKARRQALRDEQRTVMHVGDQDITAADLDGDERQMRLFKAQQLALAIDDVNDEIQQLTERLGEARLEAERARTTRVPVDDFEEMPAVPNVSVETSQERAKTRDRVTTAEAAEAFDVSPATMRRWFKGDMPHPAGDPRNAWDPGEHGALPDCILELGPRSRWLVIDKLNPGRIPPATMRALRTPS